MLPAPRRIRCAIYTRKSTDDNLERDFNSLDAQREAAEVHIAKHAGDGWVALDARYDDGGFTGRNTNRPALKQLLDDVEAGKIDSVVVYKIDRLSRYSADFSRILEVFQRRGVTLVAVTQPFDVETSPGRFSASILMAVSQLEREMIAERTRDKMRAARRRGKWIGGQPPLGYDVAPKGGALLVNPAEAERVREIFRLYLELGSLIPLVEELDRRGWRMKAWTSREDKQCGGAKFNKTTLHNLLTGVVYTGHVRFEGQLREGEHERIVDDALWNSVQDRLNRNGRRGGRRVGNKCNGLLKGLVRCGSCGAAMTHTYTQKKTALYRYYKCQTAHKLGWNRCETRSVSAPALEGAVVQHIRGCGRNPALLSNVLQQLVGEMPPVDPGDLRQALAAFDPLWEHLTPWERERLLATLIAEVRYDGPSETVSVTFHSDGIQSLCQGVTL